MKNLFILCIICILFIGCSENSVKSIEPKLKKYKLFTVYEDTFYTIFTKTQNDWIVEYKNINFDKPIILKRIILSALRPSINSGDGFYIFTIGEIDLWKETRIKAAGISPLGDFDVNVFTDCIFRYENGIQINNLYWQIIAPKNSGGMHVYITAYILAYEK